MSQTTEPDPAASVDSVTDEGAAPTPTGPNHWPATISTSLKALKSFQETPWPELVTEWELRSHIGDQDPALEVQLVQGRVQKSLLALVKQKVGEDLSWAARMKRETEWKWLNQLLAAARLKQLTLVRITRKSRKSGMGFDLTELSRTFYGKQILQSLNLGTRRVVDKEEFESVKAACARIKLVLPETIEPTRTERFFVDVAVEEAAEEAVEEAAAVEEAPEATAT